MFRACDRSDAGTQCEQTERHAAPRWRHLVRVRVRVRVRVTGALAAPAEYIHLVLVAAPRVHYDSLVAAPRIYYGMTPLLPILVAAPCLRSSRMKAA